MGRGGAQCAEAAAVDVALGAGAVGADAALDTEVIGADVTFGADARAAIMGADRAAMSNAVAAISTENRNILCQPSGVRRARIPALVQYDHCAGKNPDGQYLVSRVS